MVPRPILHYVTLVTLSIGIILACRASPPPNESTAAETQELRSKIDCPLIITDCSIGVHAVARWNRISKPEVTLKIKNATDKTIVGAFFVARSVNDLGGLWQEYSVSDTDHLELKSRSQATLYRPMPPDFHFLPHRKTTIAVLNVAYEDGSSWRDDGSRHCSAAGSR